MSETFNEHVIEWMRGDETATVSAPNNTRLKGQVTRLAEKYPDEVDYIENKDGSICGHVPVKYVNVRHPKVLSDEHKQKLAESLARKKAE